MASTAGCMYECITHIPESFAAVKLMCTNKELFCPKGREFCLKRK